MTAFVHGVVKSSVGQAVWVLNGANARQTMLLSQTNEFVNAIRRFIGQANVTNLASLDQLAQGLQLFVNAGLDFVFAGIEIHHAKHRHMALRPMNLIQINHVCLQALETGIARFQYILRCQASAFAHPGHAA